MSFGLVFKFSMFGESFPKEKNNMPQFGNYCMDSRNSAPQVTPAEEAFEKLDAAGVRWVVERAMASEEEKNRADQFHKDVATFRHMYPAYLDSEHNKRLMVHHWTEVLGTSIPTFAEIEETFFSLRGSGVLQLNAKAVAKEDAAAVAVRADEIIAARKAAEFNEADAYSMPLEELEKRARGF
jgi:hypothetical protein